MACFAPAKREKQVISIRIEQLVLKKVDEIANTVDEIANTIDISRNEVINQCIKYAIENSDFSDRKKNSN